MRSNGRGICGEFAGEAESVDDVDRNGLDRSYGFHVGSGLLHPCRLERGEWKQPEVNIMLRQQFYIYNLGFWELFPKLEGAKYPLTQTMAIELGILAAVVIVSCNRSAICLSLYIDT